MSEHARAREEERAKICRLPWALASGGFGSVYGSLVLGTIFVLFLDEMGLPKTHIGLLMALMFLPGPLALVAAPISARRGFKRVYMWFYTTRKLVAFLIVFTPAVLERFGIEGVVTYTVAVMSVYGILRVIAETAYYPWIQEFVPNRVRGQYMAISNIVSTLVGMAAVRLAGDYIAGADTGLERYQEVIAVGCLFGVASVLIKLPIKGGAPAPERLSQRAHFRQMRVALGDLPFRRFLLGLGVVALATNAWGTFLPLYMKEEIGLDSGVVLQLQMWSMLGTLLSSYAWGWAADRLGSRPVLVSGLMVMALLPPVWLSLPDAAAGGAFWAGVAAAVWGIANIGYSIGHERQLYVEMVPEKKKTEYMALYYTWTQITAVLSPLIAGWGLDRSPHESASSPYQMFFLISFLGLLFGIVLLVRAWRPHPHSPPGSP